MAEPSTGGSARATYVTTAGNTNRLKFRTDWPNGFVPKVTGLAGKSDIFIPMVFGLDLPRVVKPPAPLILYVTPSEISIQRRKVLTEHYLRSGPIREEWGNELDVWNCSGWIAAFYKSVTQETRDKNGVDTQFQVNPVLTQIDRDDSAGYRNFTSLLSFYKNNGRTYYDRGLSSTPQRSQLGSTVDGEQVIDRRGLIVPTEVTYVNVEDEGGTQSRIGIQPKMEDRKAAVDYRNKVRRKIRENSKFGISSTMNTLTRPSRQIHHVGSVIITYDMRILIGHFDTFEWTESVDHPYQIKYAFTFVVKAQYDMASEWSGQGTVRG